jgi:hypothetical protein
MLGRSSISESARSPVFDKSHEPTHESCGATLLVLHQASVDNDEKGWTYSGASQNVVRTLSIFAESFTERFCLSTLDVEILLEKRESATLEHRPGCRGRSSSPPPPRGSLQITTGGKAFASSQIAIQNCAIATHKLLVNIHY